MVQISSLAKKGYYPIKIEEKISSISDFTSVPVIVRWTILRILWIAG